MKHACFLTLLLILLTGCCSTRIDPGLTEFSSPRLEPVELLPGNMDQWRSINFGGEGDAFFKDGALNLDYGSPLTGVKHKGDLADLLGESIDHYAITLQAQRVEGTDLFLGVTFPVGKDGHVSLVLGGWGGAITGLSNLDDLNASENKTTRYHAFADKRWYKVKILVAPEKIQCWLDDEQIVDVQRADYAKYDTHGAVIDTKPFGLFSYGTWGRVTDLKVWPLE